MKKTNENIETPAIGCKIGRAYQIMLIQLSKALKEAGIELTTSDYLVMRAVYRYPGAQQCEIAELVGKDKAAVCRSVTGLVKNGYLTTESVSHKCLRVYPSDKGLELEPYIMRVANQRHHALLDFATPDELNIFNRILDNIINSK